MPFVDHNKNIIEVNHVFFSYGTNTVLIDVNLAIHRGDYLGIIGPNGAGKTTLFKIMLGLLTPKSGTVKLFGVDIRNFQDHLKVAYVPQKASNFDVNFPITVKEVVAMGRYAKKGLFHNLQAEDNKIIRNSLEQVKMQEYANVLIGELSGGEVQRVFIARALAGQPEVVFLDEPTAGIDQKSQDDFYGLLKELNQKMGLTLVLISHDIERLTKEVMHIACLDHNLVCHNSPEEFLRDSDSLNLDGQKVKVITHHHYN
ncbi:MAG: metal ABC transporter ATP-binding protein [Patescibacteria group bacterium]|jgi:zinc transport system ATP-binding protein